MATAPKKTIAKKTTTVKKTAVKKVAVKKVAVAKEAPVETVAAKKVVAPVAAKKAVKVSADERYVYGVGRRKTAVAQVRLYKAKGEPIHIANGKTVREYFGTQALEDNALSPLKVVGLEGEMMASLLVRGGGKNGQSDAAKLGVARALLVHDPLLRPVLKAQGLLTRDARSVERKKPGLKKARKSPQWSKR
jgi:small subunit ribosomal protein S9